jgi:hypothetical protein
MITVPVIVGGSATARFVLDTGIGVNLISTRLCQSLGCEPTGGTVTGKRMSGRPISTHLTRVPSISIDSLRQENVVAGIFDPSGFLPKDSGLEGFLSPQFFEPWAFAINSLTQTVRIVRPGSDSARPRGISVPIEVRRDGPSVQLFIDLVLPSGRTISAEVDSGSDDLILHTRFMRELGADPDRADVKKAEGADETGHSYTRFFAQVRGTLSVSTAPRVVQRDPKVMFQDIIYDGLVGDSFLRSYDVTYDLARSQMIFGDP